MLDNMINTMCTTAESLLQTMPIPKPNKARHVELNKIRSNAACVENIDVGAKQLYWIMSPPPHFGSLHVFPPFLYIFFPVFVRAPHAKLSEVGCAIRSGLTWID